MAAVALAFPAVHPDDAMMMRVDKVMWLLGGRSSLMKMIHRAAEPGEMQSAECRMQNAKWYPAAEGVELLKGQLGLKRRPAGVDR